MKTVLLIGTLDTKGIEYQYIREKLEAQVVRPFLMDVSCKRLQSEFSSDLSCKQVAQAAGVDFTSVSQLERVPAQKVMIEGAVKLAEELFQQGRFHGIMALGGSNGSAIACAVMQRFPFGMPKLMVSTLPSGDVRSYVGYKDIVMFNPVGDISLNRMTKKIFLNAIMAMAGMLKEDPTKEEVNPVRNSNGALNPAGINLKCNPAAEQRGIISNGVKKVQVAVSVFGVVQPCAEHAKELLEEKGFEVILFHTSGTGGMALEEMVRQGEIDAVLDLSTTELADEAVGGVLSAGPHRMEAAGAAGIPQVIVPGAIDLVNFKTPETVPEKWKDRIFYRHTPHITLMRTDVEESKALGQLFAKKLNQARGPTLVLIPLKGFSAYDSPGGPKSISLQGGLAARPWFWPEADRSFYEELKRNIDPTRVRYQELPMHINDPGFAEIAVWELEEMIRENSLRVRTSQ
ncbi:MAG: Tm-1-like ATP-binding domain-containing protein [Thermodesulfobacteriota bacterium]|nr:Tm-1-like ATP-binding domain-containing protein [Thermodesulfobacteriota bacterium]